ncbi:MAG: helix-turn-helix domain-containing protein [Akkermansiaceae bacterium]|jgi:DNA-binding response OmpR family regulator
MLRKPTLELILNRWSSREQFLDGLWEYNAWPTTRAVDTFVAKLWAKIEGSTNESEFVLTELGIGYKLTVG